MSGLDFNNTFYYEISEFSVVIPYFGEIINSKWDFSHSNLSTSSITFEVKRNRTSIIFKDVN